MTNLQMRIPLRTIGWLGFFAAILAAWWFLATTSLSMGLDFIGRPNAMAQAMAQMDPTMGMNMPMAQFQTLFGMWVLMMAAMMSS